MPDADKIFKWTTIDADEAKKIGFVESSWDDWKKSHHIRNDNSAQFKHERLKVISDDKNALHALIFKDSVDQEYCFVIFVREAPWITGIVHGIDILVDLVDETRCVAMAKGAMQRLHAKGLNASAQRVNSTLMLAYKSKDEVIIAEGTKALNDLLADICAWAGVSILPGQNNGG